MVPALIGLLSADLRTSNFGELALLVPCLVNIEKIALVPFAVINVLEKIENSIKASRLHELLFKIHL